MKLANWNINTQRVINWMQSTDNDIEQEATAINAILTLAGGVDDEVVLGTYWTSIRSIGGVHEDFPKARVGQPTNYPESVAMSVDSVRSHIHNVFVLAFDEVVAQVMLPRGQGSRYDANLFGEAMADKAQGVLEKAYKAKPQRWDGELSESGVPSVALIEKEDTTE